MAQGQNQFVRYTFVTEECTSDLTAVLTYMREHDILPSVIETEKSGSRARVVISSCGSKDWHSHAIAAQFEGRPSVQHFGFERLSSDALRAA